MFNANINAIGARRRGVSINLMTQEGEAFNNGKIVLTFDDATIGHYSLATPLLIAKGVKATFYAPASAISSSPSFISWEQVKEMQSLGMDIEGHSESTLAGLQATNSLYIAHGMGSPKHTAYDGGVYNDTIIDDTDDYRKTGRITTSSVFYINRKSDKYTLPSFMVWDDAARITTLKGLMNNSQINKLALTIYIHHVSEEYSNYSISPSNIEEIINYAREIGMDVITIDELYNQMLYINLRAVRVSDTQIDLIFKHTLTTTHQISIERSTDGVNYSEINITDIGVESYSDTSLDINTTYYYKVRAMLNGSYLPYSREISISTAYDTWTLKKTGDGTGVSTLTINSDEAIQLKIDGSGKFYSNSAGTLNESDTLSIGAGNKTIYIRVPSGTAYLYIQRNALINIYWTSAANAPNLSFRVSRHRKLEILNLAGTNTAWGAITELTALNTLQIKSNNTINGSIAGLVNLIIAGLGGLNTINGSVAGCILLRYLTTSDSCLVTIPNVTNIKGFCYLYYKGLVTSENANQILADFWANRDEEKLMSERGINILGSALSGGPTGQGLLDKAALQAYRSPNNDPVKSLWSVTTR